jgi:hypothetical protein
MNSMMPIVTPESDLISLGNRDFQTFIQALSRGAGGARTHDRRIMSPLL